MSKRGMLADHLPMSVNESAAPITHHKNGFQNYRAIMALSAILGCYDRKGGQLPVKFSYNYQPAGFETREEEFVNSVKPENSRPAVGAKRFPLWNDYIDEAQANDLARQIETGDPYAIKALMGFGYNYRIGPDTTRVKKALMQLDFIAMWICS
jgi:anaerobic selenocysteine-containing dehydrogenase